MLTGVPLSVASANIALFNWSNENSLADSLVRLASGRRINKPSDSIPDYFYSEKLQRNSRSLDVIINDIEDGRALIDVAASAGESVFNALTEMNATVRTYYLDTTSDDEKTALSAEFDALKQAVTAVIGSSRYDGMTIVSDNGGIAHRQVALNDERTVTLDIMYTADDITDVSSLTLGTTDEATESAAVEAQLGRAGSYMAKTSAFMRGLTAHYNMTVGRMDVTVAAADRIVEADTGEEYVQSLNKSIRNQSSLAMLAQANVFRSSILRLFE